MGFRKEIYDVEEKELEPTKPHSKLAEDGRLARTSKKPKTPVVKEDSKKEPSEKTASETKKKVTTSPKEKTAPKSDVNEPSNALKELPADKDKSATTTSKRSKKSK